MRSLHKEYERIVLRIGSTPLRPLGQLTAIERTQKAIARSLERLATGARVSQFSEDPVAVSQSLSLQSQSRGLRQIVQGLNQAQGDLQLSSTALSSQLDLIAQIRQIALQASSSTLSAGDRAELTSQLKTLLTEFSRVSADSPSGTMSLYTGDSQPISFDLPSSSPGSVFKDTVGTGTFLSVQCISTADSEFIHTADLNSDGNLDIVTGDELGGVAVVLGTGQGKFSGQSTYSTDPLDGGFDIGDANGDGIADILLRDMTGRYLRGRGDGTFDAAEDFYSVVEGPVSALKGIYADFNNDGYSDLIYTDSSDLRLALNDGEGRLGETTVIETGRDSSFNFHTADFNHDGFLDLAFRGDSSALYQPYVYLNNQDGSFTQSWTVGSGGGGDDIALGDFNNDSHTDIAFVDAAVTQIYLGTGTGSFDFKANLSAHSARPAVAGDVNGDGLDDLISSSRNIFISKGDGTFTLSASLPFSSNLGNSLIYGASFGLADFNNDGVLDIFSGNRGTAIALGRTREVSAVNQITDISSAEKARDLLAILDKATESIQLQQSKVSALHSRLDYTSASNLVLADTLDEARSRLMEPDYALEIAELTRLQILQQSQVAVAAQANLSMQIVLQLL